MRNNETGEFELVVGDRQLLSAFFIVVLLCAVAFAMGYVVGQNAPRSGKATAEGTAPAPSAGQGADARPQPLPPAATPAPTPAASESSDKSADSAPQPTTQPAQGSEPAKPQTKAAAPAAQTSPAAPTEPVAAADLPAGSYWQVMAVAQTQAEILRTTLKDHGFQVYLSPGSKGLIRVLVGPYPDTQSMGKAKTDLEAAGLRPVRFKP